MCAHALLALDLQFANFECASMGKAHQQATVFNNEMGGSNKGEFRGRLRGVDLQRPLTKRGERTRSRLETAEPVPGLRGAAREID